VTIELDVTLPDGRTVHAYDTGGYGLPVLWQHGTPNVGAPPAPLLAAAGRLDLRWVGHDRPGYGGSTPWPGRSVGSVATDVAAVADALGLDRFAVLGHSSGGSHAVACGALLADRVVAVVDVSGPAPYDSPGLDWFAGMGPVGEASLRAALAGREEKERFETTADAMLDFTASDEAVLGGEWSWFMEVVGPATARGPAPLIDDDLALVAPWGADPADCVAPTLLLHGADDRVVPAAHSEWLPACAHTRTCGSCPATATSPCWSTGSRPWSGWPGSAAEQSCELVGSLEHRQVPRRDRPGRGAQPRGVPLLERRRDLAVPRRHDVRRAGRPTVRRHAVEVERLRLRGEVGDQPVGERVVQSRAEA